MEKLTKAQRSALDTIAKRPGVMKSNPRVSRVADRLLAAGLVEARAGVEVVYHRPSIHRRFVPYLFATDAGRAVLPS